MTRLDRRDSSPRGGSCRWLDCGIIEIESSDIAVKVEPYAVVAIASGDHGSIGAPCSWIG
jgi:hypothetical protein